MLIQHSAGILMDPNLRVILNMVNFMKTVADYCKLSTRTFDAIVLGLNLFEIL